MNILSWNHSYPLHMGGPWKYILRTTHAMEKQRSQDSCLLGVFLQGFRNLLAASFMGHVLTLENLWKIPLWGCHTFLTCFLDLITFMVNVASSIWHPHPSFWPVLPSRFYHSIHAHLSSWLNGSLSLNTLPSTLSCQQRQSSSLLLNILPSSHPHFGWLLLGLSIFRIPRSALECPSTFTLKSDPFPLLFSGAHVCRDVPILENGILWSPIRWSLWAFRAYPIWVFIFIDSSWSTNVFCEEINMITNVQDWISTLHLTTLWTIDLFSCSMASISMVANGNELSMCTLWSFIFLCTLKRGLMR